MIDVTNISIKEAGYKTNQKEYQLVLMSASIFILNISLMLFASYYWLDPDFHVFIAGKPL